MFKKFLKIFLALVLVITAGKLAWPNITLLVIISLLFIFLVFWPKAFLRFFIGLVAFVLLIILLIQTPPVQNFVVGKFTNRLSRDLNTTVKIGHVNIALFDKIDLRNTLILDQRKDTLLHAGSLKLRITDWFFLKRNIELKYIGIEDAVINQQRTDSIWNYQFLIDHFSSPGKAKTQSSNITLKIQKVDLKNVVYVKNDDWQGKQLIIKTGSLLVDADNVDVSRNVVLINSIDMDKTFVTMENYDGKNKDTSTSKSTGRLNPSNLLIRVTALNIKNSYFATGVRGTVAQDNVFNGRRIQVSKINGAIKNFNFIKDTITADINLSAVERSGFKLKKLQAAYRFTPQKMEFSKLLIKTNKSTVTNYFVMQFKNFNTDMGNYVHNVVMRANIKNSSVYSDDIAFFAPALSTWNQSFLLDGYFNGTVSDFTVRNLFAKNGANTYVSGDLAMKDITDANKRNIILNNANVQTNIKEIAFILPALASVKSPDLAALGNVHFIGNFNATSSKFNAKGTIASSLGGLNTDIALSFPARGEPAYKGSLQTQQFNLGKFLSIPNLGNVSFNGRIEGSSFRLDRINTRVDGTFASLTFKNYTYSNLAFNGAISHRKFEGDFKANDVNFNFTSKILVDLSGDVPAFNLFGDLVNANLHALQLTRDSVVVTGLFDLDFRGRNIDDFLGYAKILNATVTHNTRRLDFDSLALSVSLNSANQRRMVLESNEFVVAVEGQYSILKLPQSFQSFLNRYFPSYINPPRTALSNQNFTVSIQTANFEDYARLIDSNLSGFNNANLNGRISTNNGNHFNFEINIPSAGFRHLSLEDARITGNGTDDSLMLAGNIGRFNVSDSTYFPNTAISIVSANDLSRVRISTRANATLNKAELDADVRTLPDGVSIQFHPSSFVLNDKEWKLQNQGEVVIRNHFSSARNMKFTQGFQEISIESLGDESTSDALAVRLKNVNMGDIFPLFITRPSMEGVANGNIYLRNIYTNFNADSKLQLTQFRLNNDSIGVVDITAKFDNSDGRVIFSANADNYNFVMDASGYYNLRDTLNSPLHTTLKLDHAKIGILNTYLGTLFDDITGFATGTITMYGSFKDLRLGGQAHLDSGALTVRYTQVRYTIPSADFVFNEDGIDFGNFTAKDKFGNTAKVGGTLYETGFRNNRYNFSMSTDKLLLLDTKLKDNPLFYGTVIGKATLALTGPQENMQLAIKGEPADISTFYIQTNTSKKSADADFIIFKQYGEQVITDTTENTNLNISLDLTANNKVTVSVILDELTGDIIEATGNGRLLIKVPAIGDVTMTGRYNIEQGNYNFNFQSVVKRPFELVGGQNSYIEWTGDPFNANINITARYTAKNVSISGLTGGSGILLDPNISGYRGDVYVVADLVGKLSQPQIKFSLDFPEGSAIRTNDNFNRLLARMESDENEMLKQVTWLIVFDSFSPYGELTSASSFVQSTGINTISQKIASVLNSKISDLLYNLTGDRTLQFDVGAKTYSSTNLTGSTTANALDRTAVELKINKSLLNNKMIVTFGGDLDFSVNGAAAAATQNNFQWLPDISVQIILSRDRKLRAIIFNHSSLGATNTGTVGRVTRQGVSISYTRDFNRLFGNDDDVIYLGQPAPDSLLQEQKKEKNNR